MAISIQIYLDDAVLSRALRFVSPNDIEQWVNQLVAAQISELEHLETAASMREGYIVRQQESSNIYEDWQITDGEGWT